MAIIANLVHRIIQLITLMVIIQAVLTYFMSPYDPIRHFFDRIVNPLLAPIRRIIPPVGMLDLSPLILIILLQVIDVLIRSILLSF